MDAGNVWNDSFYMFIFKVDLISDMEGSWLNAKDINLNTQDLGQSISNDEYFRNKLIHISKEWQLIVFCLKEPNYECMKIIFI